MKETHITIYIHDLEISDKSKSFLARVGLMKLDDLLNCNMTELSAIRNISEDVLQELNGVIAHSDVIISFFEERAKRIKEILPNVQDAPIESLGLGTRATNALRRGGIHTVGALIQMSQKDIFELCYAWSKQKVDAQPKQEHYDRRRKLESVRVCDL